MEANTESQHRTRHVKMELLRRDFAKMLCQKATDQPHIRPQNQAPSSKHSKVTQRLPKLQDTSSRFFFHLFSSSQFSSTHFHSISIPFPITSDHLRWQVPATNMCCSPWAPRRPPQVRLSTATCCGRCQDGVPPGHRGVTSFGR